MTQTVTLSDQVYNRLKIAAGQHGFKSIEEFLETLSHSASDISQRQETVRSIRMLREHLSAKYGVAPDSVDLLRVDRMR